MEDHTRSAVFNIDIVYLYYNVAEAGSVIFGQLGFMDFCNLALVNKHFRAMVMDYGGMKNDLRSKMVTTQSSDILCNLPSRCIRVCNNIVSYWSCPRMQPGEQWLAKGHIYLLSRYSKAISRHCLYILKDHILNDNPFPPKDWHSFYSPHDFHNKTLGRLAPVTWVYAEEKKIALCITYFTPYRNEHFLVLLYDIFKNTLIQKETFHPTPGMSIFKLNSEMAVFLERMDLDETTDTMKVQVNVSSRHENFMQMKCLGQIPCVYGHITDCIVFDDSFVFEVYSKNPSSKICYKVCLSKDITSIECYVSFFESPALEWLETGHAYSHSRILFRNQLWLMKDCLCFHPEGQKRWVTLNDYPLVSCKSSDGNLAVACGEQWKRCTLIVFNSLGDRIYQRQIKELFHIPCSMALVGNTLFMGLKDHLYFIDTKENSVVKKKVCDSFGKPYQDLHVQDNGVILSTLCGDEGKRARFISKCLFWD